MFAVISKKNKNKKSKKVFSKVIRNFPQLCKSLWKAKNDGPDSFVGGADTFV